MSDKPRPKIDFQSFDSPEFWTGDFSTFAAEIGYATWAWNALHADLCDLLWGLVGTEAPYVPRAIWNAIKSDSGQRDVLKAAAKAKLEEGETLEAIVWLVDEVGQIAAHRNDIAHTLWRTEPDPNFDPNVLRKAVPDPERGNPRGARLVDVDAGTRFKELAGYCMTLVQYARFIGGRVGPIKDDGPLPERPQRPPSLRAPNPSKENNPQPKREEPPRPPDA